MANALHASTLRSDTRWDVDVPSRVSVMSTGHAAAKSVRGRIADTCGYQKHQLASWFAIQ